MQDAEGSMSKAQRQRFNRIRDKYSRAFASSASARKDDSPATVRKAAERQGDKRQTTEEAKDTITRVSLELARVEEIIGALQLPQQALTPKMDIQEKASVSAEVPSVPDWHYGFTADAVLCSPVNLGVTLFATYRRVGAFISLASDFRYHGTEYNCSSDGTLPEGGSFWGNGTSSTNRNMVLAGPVYDLGHGFSVFGGVGYGTCSTAWQDLDSSWANVEDLDFKGLATGAGTIKTFGHIAVSASIRYFPSGKEVYPAIGIGLAF